MQIETIAAHSGRQLDLGAGAISAPIHLSTTSERDADGAFPRGFEYSRDDNPNRRSPDPAGRRSKRPESCNAGARRSPPRTGLTLLSLIFPVFPCYCADSRWKMANSARPPGVDFP